MGRFCNFLKSLLNMNRNIVNIRKISELQIKFKNGSRSSIWNLSKVEIACMDGNGIRVREIFRTLSGQDRIETDSVVSLKLGILKKIHLAQGQTVFVQTNRLDGL